MPPTPTSQLVPSRDGAPIYTDAAGDPTKPCLVFVHDFTLSGAVFDNLFGNPKLIANFYLIRYAWPRTKCDARIVGRLFSEIFAEDFKAMMHAFRIEKPIYVGCFGGTYCIIVYDIASHLPKDTLAGVCWNY
ncbi:hypothetical protein EDD18DRAFT_1382709 [Armillaria luteobubalina]|uniref:Uncharacterized protein n=1 Tax=Armillaria luteobubalina TaxID=153913 RepID=A0AA39UYB2_9AGAR|nr:hypothetical protein EDD18DRAFT_1382709 [Armillaria luteobubalina]